MGKKMFERYPKISPEETKKVFKAQLKNLLMLYGYGKADKILIHLGENSGVKGGEITIYF